MPRGGKRKNAGRHRSTSPMTRILVRMPMPLYQHLKALAAKNEVSINSAIHHILNAYVGISKA
jgi:predicted HicB family RNase H-like nuclease